MSDRKTTNRVQQLSKYIWKLYRRLTKGFVTWLLRATMISNRRRQSATGFVLPTTIFLILVVTLTAGALSYRAFNTSTRTIGNIQSKAIYNSATPAIDRARAKLDFLFGKDTRLPGGVPAEEFMISMMLNDGVRKIGEPGVSENSAPKLTGTFPGAVTDDPYTLMDENGVPERRIDVNGDGLLDNAWTYTDAATGNVVTYSINLSTPDDPLGTADNQRLGPLKLLEMSESQKAAGSNGGPFVRTGPISNSEAVKCKGQGGKIEAGWYEDKVDTSILRKRFQVQAFVVNPQDVAASKPANFTTMEFSQDRKLDRGNKWGAWFRYDMELHVGAPAKMNWNGAMHTEGSLMIGNNDTFEGYLISSPSSCLFLPISNSEISTRQFDQQLDDPSKPFFGVIGAGRINANSYGGSSRIHTYDGNTFNDTTSLTTTTDWANEVKSPIGIASDPIAILTQDLQQARSPDITNAPDRKDPNSDNLFFKKRFNYEVSNTRPYVDDTYRADNRWGPKVQYKDDVKFRIPSGSKVGFPIDPTRLDLVSDSVTNGGDVGLDGYWERRTFKDSAPDDKTYSGGMRILVGERLELGNPFGWAAPQNRPDVRQEPDQPPPATPPDNDFDDLRPAGATAATADPDLSDNEGDPLNPPYQFTNPTRAHEARQRRALRDNLAAVQATAIYHYRAGEGNDGKYPAACMVTTAHPGSPLTLQRSVDFRPYSFNGTETLISDFFYGKGTNGWEFTPPSSAELASATSPIGIALRNLANFSGDYNPANGQGGAFPPTQEAGKIHPDPNLTMWGNYSNLKRALQGSYASLSPADKSYLHTAGCTLGMLAYNVNQVQKYNPASPANTSAQATLGGLLVSMMDGNNELGQIEDVLPSSQLSTYQSGSFVAADYNPRDYDRVTPAMFLAKLQKYLVENENIAEPENDPRYQTALLIHEHFQIRRDRTYGFRPSPAANTWNYNPFVIQLPFGINKPTLWSSACDPTSFNVGSLPATAISTPNLTDIPVSAAGNRGLQMRRRLALSRLCGKVIPPGAVHDFPGDYSYPGRKGTPAAGTQFLPNNGDPADIPGVEALPKGVDAANYAKFTDGASAINQGVYSTDETYKRALVAPEFPSLYYIFPEFTHGHAGADDSASSGVDHRQPGNSSTVGANGTPVLTGLPAAFQPWSEDYITKVTNSATYQPVDAGTNAVPADPAYPAAGVPVASNDLVGTAVTAFNYKALPAFPVPDKSVALGAGSVLPRDTIANWTLPKTIGLTVPNNTENAPPNLIRQPDANGTLAAVPFLDRVMFNGREWLPDRVLDIDLEMLRSSTLGADENWLPVSGIVYAFREDARREDAIARPSNGLTSGIAGVRPENGNTVKAQVPGSETDPALVNEPGSDFNISIKPVDYLADPDRRSSGFRLRRGSNLKRTAGGIPGDKNVRGITFVSDDPTYILGDFNKHQNSDGDRLEEFTQQVPSNPTDYNSDTFYRNRTTIDQNFADRDLDSWRPSEILADSINILSPSFCDGSVIDTFMTASLTTGNANPPTGIGLNSDRSSGSTAADAAYQGVNVAEVYNQQDKGLFAPGCRAATNASGITSFLNQNRPSLDLAVVASPAPATPQWNWVRENPSDPINSPVKISRNGNGLVSTFEFDGNGTLGTASRDTSVQPKPIVPVEYSSTNGPANADYIALDVNAQDRGRPLQLAQPVNVNAILISGIIPSRQNQGYGGMHNFPRLLEWWRDVPLRFAGSFLQLNFSNYATGPYDQESWEPNAAGSTATTVADDIIDYYGFAPLRLWGYDVALKLAPVSPAASRFTTPGTDRNEFYNEPRANDPYMQKLCNAVKQSPPANVTLTNLNCPT